MSTANDCLGSHHDFVERLATTGAIYCRRCGAELVLDDDHPRIYPPTIAPLPEERP